MKIKKLLSLNKVDTSGNFIENKKEKTPSSVVRPKNDNTVEQLESLLKQQTDMLLPLMVSLSNKTDSLDNKTDSLSL